MSGNHISQNLRKRCWNCVGSEFMVSIRRWSRKYTFIFKSLLPYHELIHKTPNTPYNTDWEKTELSNICLPIKYQETWLNYYDASELSRHLILTIFFLSRACCITIFVNTSRSHCVMRQAIEIPKRKNTIFLGNPPGASASGFPHL
jgi:hypothetical protein